MKVEILYFEDCPSYAVAQWILREVMVEEGITGEIELIAVNTNEEAQSLKFPGSPTIRLAGRDLFPAAEYEGYGLGCRIYSTPEGFKGCPTAQMFREALLKGANADPVVFGDETYTAGSTAGHSRPLKELLKLLAQMKSPNATRCC